MRRIPTGIILFLKVLSSLSFIVARQQAGLALGECWLYCEGNILEETHDFLLSSYVAPSLPYPAIIHTGSQHREEKDSERGKDGGHTDYDSWGGGLVGAKKRGQQKSGPLPILYSHYEQYRGNIEASSLSQVLCMASQFRCSLHFTLIFFT